MPSHIIRTMHFQSSGTEDLPSLSLSTLCTSLQSSYNYSHTLEEPAESKIIIKPERDEPYHVPLVKLEAGVIATPLPELPKGRVVPTLPVPRDPLRGSTERVVIYPTVPTKVPVSLKVTSEPSRAGPSKGVIRLTKLSPAQIKVLKATAMKSAKKAKSTCDITSVLAKRKLIKKRAVGASKVVKAGQERRKARKAVGEDEDFMLPTPAEIYEWTAKALGADLRNHIKVKNIS